MPQKGSGGTQRVTARESPGVLAGGSDQAPAWRARARSDLPGERVVVKLGVAAGVDRVKYVAQSQLSRAGQQEVRGGEPGRIGVRIRDGDATHPSGTRGRDTVR